MASEAAPLRGRRFLVAKPGLDGHDIGAKVIAMTLRDAGAEVIYTGLRCSPGHIVRVALEEDVDAVGLSMLSGGHLELVGAIAAGLREQDAGNVKLFVGGTVPVSDHGALRDIGVSAIFSSDDRIEDVIATIVESFADQDANA